MNTLNFVRKIVDQFQKDSGIMEPDVNDLRDFIAVSCWSVVQLNQIHQAMLNADTGLHRQYTIVSQNILDSHLLLVAKGMGRDYFNK